MPEIVTIIKYPNETGNTVTRVFDCLFNEIVLRPRTQKDFANKEDAEKWIKGQNKLCNN